MKITKEKEVFAVGCPCCTGPMCAGNDAGDEMYELFSNPMHAKQAALGMEDGEGKPLTRIVKAKIIFYES